MVKAQNPTAKDPEKSVDLPPYGPRNPDPISDQPGSHPIETGIGAALGGAASGMAVGAVGGPIGAVVGALVGGAVAGGLAGKGIGELIDPTTEDNWLRSRLKKSAPTDPRDTTWETQAREAYRFGWRAESRYPGLAFNMVESTVRTDWEYEYPNRPWSESRAAVADGFEQGRTTNGTGDDE